MQVYIPDAARTDLVYYPHHFEMLAQHFAPEQTTFVSSLADVEPGGWALVIRSPGAFALSRLSLNARGQRKQPTVFEVITPAERRATKEKGALLIDLGWEILFAYDDLLEGLVRSIEMIDLDPTRIFILHCNYAAGPLLADSWKKHTSLPQIRTIPFPVTLALMNVWQQKTRSLSEIEERLSIGRVALGEKHRARRYCFFNGEPRPHRILILCYLYSSGVLDDGFVSMLANKKAGDANKFKEIGSDAERYRVLARKIGATEEIVDAIDAILTRLPMTLDVEAGELKQSLQQIAWSSPDPRFYKESWFSVVADTLFFDDNVMFVTEKVMKPIINAAPFFYFGNAGGLKHLSDWGFQLQGGLFKPEFDLVSDGKARMDGVLAGIVAACRMTESDLRDAAIAEWPTVARNYRHFWWGFRDRLTTAFRQEVLDVVANAATS